jgi:hypothetical protein
VRADARLSPKSRPGSRLSSKWPAARPRSAPTTLFRPLLPEVYTSLGRDLAVYLDRLPKPGIRRVPQVAATDGGNATFFTVDSALDPDMQRGFFGISGSASHAAAISALVLQTKGGPGDRGHDSQSHRHRLDAGRPLRLHRRLPGRQERALTARSAAGRRGPRLGTSLTTSYDPSGSVARCGVIRSGGSRPTDMARPTTRGAAAP